MNPLDLFNLEREKFANFVFDFVSKDTLIYFRGKKEHPIDQGCIKLLGLYSYVFFDASNGVRPSIPEIGLFLEGGGDIASLYQDACYWFDRWRKNEDVLARCDSFCEELNSILLKKAREVCEDAWLLLPDFRARREEVRKKVSCDEGKILEGKDDFSLPCSAC